MKSFIEVDLNSHFPIQNLPYGVFRKIPDEDSRIGIRIGDFILDLHGLQENGFLEDCDTVKKGIFNSPDLNKFFELGPQAWRETRNTVTRLLQHDQPVLRDNTAMREKLLIPVNSVKMQMPVDIGDYTDFYASKEHATNVGIMFRGKDNALMPNWLHLPVAYHGRASSVVVSGTPIYRPRGQIKPDDSDKPIYCPSRMLDFELEMGFFVGTESTLSFPVQIEKADEHIFGMVLVNDWSARDIQKWEYQPLGPFNSKNFATSISPWIVTMEALEPFRCKGPDQNPEPLPYLRCKKDFAFDIQLEVWLKCQNMDRGMRVSASNFKYMYWNMLQQLAHHTVTGCNVRTGDLIASGTISAPQEKGYGSLLELTWKGTKPVHFPNGEKRSFLQDHDSVTITGWCQGNGYRVGFGEVTGQIFPPRS